MKRLVLILTLVTAPAAMAADIDLVLTQFIHYYTAQNADRTLPRMSSALQNLEVEARAVTAPGFLLSDGTWTDINYSETPGGAWSPWDHSRRLLVMARAYQTPGQSFYRSGSLRGQIDAALAQTKRFYGATILPTGNWWFWTMGIPLDLGPTLVLMRGEVDPQTYDDLVFAMHLRIGSSPTTRGLIGPTPVGQNLVWSCYTHLTLALLKDDPQMLASVAAAMSNVSRPAIGDGIKSDHSFHQHGPQLYTGGYGGAFASDVARYALLTRGTSYAMTPEALGTFADYVAEGIAWSLYGDYFDVSVVGREVARPSTTGYNGLAALLQASQFQTARTAEITSSAVKMLETWRGTMPVELAGLAAQFESSRVAGAWPSGHRHYFASDYAVHRRPGWFASVKMVSTRTKTGENTNNENLLGSRQSDGRFYLVLEGDEYFGRDVWPALDWTRLPGITVEQKADAADATYGFGTRAFGGGTGDGRNGVAAMELAPLNSSVTAKKAWFFFDDAIAFLGNSITSLSPNRVETIVNQWPLRNATSPLVRGSDWAALEGVGYWFPSPSVLKTARETRAGTWAALGGSTDTTPRTHTFESLWLDHGTSPVNASSEYVIVPNVSANQMKAWAAARPLAILANNENVSAVRDTRTGAMGIAFWTSGASIEGIQSSAPAVVYVTSDARGMRLSVSDPTAGSTEILRITIPGIWNTSDVAFARTGRATMLMIPRASGQTKLITLSPATTSKRRSVRQ